MGGSEALTVDPVKKLTSRSSGSAEGRLRSSGFVVANNRDELPTALFDICSFMTISPILQNGAAFGEHLQLSRCHGTKIVARSRRCLVTTYRRYPTKWIFKFNARGLGVAGLVAGTATIVPSRWLDWGALAISDICMMLLHAYHHVILCCCNQTFTNSTYITLIT